MRQFAAELAVLILCVAAAFFAGRHSVSVPPALEPPPLPPPPLHKPAADVLPLLYDPPTGHSKVAVSQVKSDTRGAVHNLEFGGFRVNVLVSSAGTLRSGDLHPARQNDFLFKGRARVTTRERGVDVHRNYTAGDFVRLPPFVPHM